MLKLEIKLDDNKIIADKKYNLDSIYRVLDEAFARQGIRRTQDQDGTLYYIGASQKYGSFGGIITSLHEKSWFMDYVVKWLWYNSDNGEDEDDFAIDDVLYHYTKKESVA